MPLVFFTFSRVLKLTRLTTLDREIPSPTPLLTPSPTPFAPPPLPPFQVIKGVRPDQQLVKFVSDELLELMGKEISPLEMAPRGPTVILMAGLQGVGKTTACGKLALYLKKQDKTVMMIATDVYRPAAIDQLVQLGERVGRATITRGC
eukprot:1185035-Prorocentrum_minimum.AAC.8